MGSTERSGVFCSTFGTVTSENEVDKRQLHREQRLHLHRRRTGEENVCDDDEDDNRDNDQPSAGQEEEARAYILDLGGWKSEIAPYWAVRHGGAL